MWIFNTILGEEMLFRGLLLPRMNRVFGRADWLANGVLFAAYHVHMPWAMPRILLDALALAYPTKRFRSAWMGIAIHSMQSIFLGVVVLLLVI
jgi:membrane protease YdiL (CAAX protease family)